MSSPSELPTLGQTAEFAWLDEAIEPLTEGAGRLTHMSLADRRELLQRCAAGVVRAAVQWVALACGAKQIAADQPVAAEEILAGPVSTLRYLRLLTEVLGDVERSSTPKLPGKTRTNSLGRTCVPVLPIRSLYDSLIFSDLDAEVWLRPGVNLPIHFDSDAEGPAVSTSTPAKTRIAGVLGAGNVSSIPATDMLYKIFRDSQAVLLKLNPVNDYLEPVFAEAFGPLIEANLLRIVRGGREMGEAIVQHPAIETLHLTGSHLTHDAIVWGSDPAERERRRQQNQPLVCKPVTSELGNVSPWMIVPGDYSPKQLRSQAEHVAASIANNASFNCLATKMIITSRTWPQREEFLDLVESILATIPPRYAYYPGAAQRFERATGHACPDREDGTLPWTLIRDAKPDESPHLFQEESFVCVCAETQLDAESPEAFLETAVEFANQRLFGTLCATVTLPAQFSAQQSGAVERAVANLQYGSVCLNQWSAIVYGLMTPPWGGFPGATMADPQSGIGQVHNTFGIQHIEKTVVRGPLCSFPKPVWFPSHRAAHHTAWALLKLYERPHLTRLPAVFISALRG